MDPLLLAATLNQVLPLVDQVVTFLRSNGNPAGSTNLKSGVVGLVLTEVSAFANAGGDIGKIAKVVTDLATTIQQNNGLPATGLIDNITAGLLSNYHGNNTTPPANAGGNPGFALPAGAVPLYYRVTDSVKQILSPFDQTPGAAFTLAEQLVSTAVDMWRSSFAPPKQLQAMKRNDNNVNLIVLLTGDSDDDGQLNDPSGGILALTEVGGPGQMMNGNKPLLLRLNKFVQWHPFLFLATVTHELGHALGINKHTDEVGISDPQSVMNRFITTVDAPDQTDFSRMAQVWP